MKGIALISSKITFRHDGRLCYHVRCVNVFVEDENALKNYWTPPCTCAQSASHDLRFLEPTTEDYQSRVDLKRGGITLGIRSMWSSKILFFIFSCRNVIVYLP